MEGCIKHINHSRKINCYKDMINNIIELLNTSKFYGVSENIDIAKGKYEIPSTWSDTFKNIKRRLWQIRKLRSK